LWNIWKRRNLKVCQQVDESTNQLMEHDVHFLEDLKMAQAMHSSRSENRQQQQAGMSTDSSIQWKKLSPRRMNAT